MAPPMPTLKDQTATDSAAGRDTENCQGNGVAPPIQILKDQTINDADVRSSSTLYTISMAMYHISLVLY